ncbi:MAG: helix-turn-helix transcriptional regulator [Clostridia bacterium]|nr:helix-turn-helix transcriptional regulator [Clostridia bacterium]
MKISKFSVEILLAEKNMTKSEMAKRASLSRQSVNDVLKRGTCEPRTLGKIAAALEVDVENLIAKEG